MDKLIKIRVAFSSSVVYTDRVIKKDSYMKKKCESCGAIWFDDGQYSGHCDGEDL